MSHLHQVNTKKLVSFHGSSGGFWPAKWTYLTVSRLTWIYIFLKTEQLKPCCVILLWTHSGNFERDLYAFILVLRPQSLQAPWRDGNVNVILNTFVITRGWNVVYMVQDYLNVKCVFETRVQTSNEEIIVMDQKLYIFISWSERVFYSLHTIQ